MAKVNLKIDELKNMTYEELKKKREEIAKQPLTKDTNAYMVYIKKLMKEKEGQK